jgi:sortase B
MRKFCINYENVGSVSGEVFDVRKLFGKKSNASNVATKRLIRRHIPTICLIAVGTFFIIIGVLAILNFELEAASARNEYQMLRDEFSDVSGNIRIITDEISDDGEPLPEFHEVISHEILPVSTNLRNLSLDELARINNNFIGWISIQNLIEYPVVLGRDNSRYLRTTFSGERNAAGAIFMDYRNKGGFDDDVIVIYGHNTTDGTMFSSLAGYLDPGFMERNSDIVITTRAGEVLTFHVFAARQTNAYDYAYAVALIVPHRAADVFPDVPDAATQFMILSTCTRGGERDERIIVFAAR